MHDDGLPTIKYKFFCTTPNWGPEEGVLVWQQDENDKCMLPDEERKPCKSNLMKNGPEIIKGLS